MSSGGPVHNVCSGYDGGQWKAAGNSLGKDQNVGFDSKLLRREHCASTSHTALNLIADQQDPMLASQGLQVAKKRRWWNYVSAFTLNRFYEYSGNFVGRQSM